MKKPQKLKTGDGASATGLYATLPQVKITSQFHVLEPARQSE
jgi:hypothetical protein